MAANLVPSIGNSLHKFGVLLGDVSQNVKRSNDVFFFKKIQ
jgi:hypothetical protein